MAKRIKFSLKMAYGEQVRSLDEMRENFDLDRVLDYFADGRLLTWLEDRDYNTEVEAIKALNKEDPELCQKLCDIFDVDINIVDQRDKKKKLALLNQFITSSELVDKIIDDTAVSQDEFEQLISKKRPTIFLLNSVFVVSSNLENVNLIGIGDVTLQTKNNEVVNLKDKNVSGMNVKFDKKFLDIKVDIKNLDKLKALVIKAVDSGLFGKKIDEDEKKQWLLTRLSFLTPKTVITITEGDQLYLVFTTYALYVYKSGGFLKDENFWSLPYDKINGTSIGTVLNKDKEANLFVFEDNGVRKDFSDKKIDVQKLEQFLLNVKSNNNYAETDKKMNFAELPVDVKIGFCHIISAILRENKHSLFELFRFVVDNSLDNHWETIIQEELNIKNFIKQWQNKISYPYEEAVTLKLVSDICTILQFTKQNEVLNANEKKYFSLILNFIETDEREEIIRKQIISAQVEKKFIEGKSVDSELEILLDYVKNSKYGSLILARGSLVSLGLTVLGPLGWIVSLLSIIEISISDYLSKRKVRETNKAELRKKLYKETLLSYERSLKVLDKMDNKDVSLYQKLEEGITVMQNNSGFTGRLLLSTHNDEIVETIKSFLNNPKIEYGEVVIANKLNYFSLQKLIAQMSFSLGSEGFDSVIGLYTGTVLGNLTGNYSGILFVKEGCYIKADKNSPIKFIFYSEIRSVSVKGTILQDVILNLSDGTSVKLDGLYYKDVGTDELFNKIAAYNRSEI